MRSTLIDDWYCPVAGSSGLAVDVGVNGGLEFDLWCSSAPRLLGLGVGGSNAIVSWSMGVGGFGGAEVSGELGADTFSAAGQYHGATSFAGALNVHVNSGEDEAVRAAAGA